MKAKRTLAYLGRFMRFRLRALLGLIVVVAVMLAVWARNREAYVPWNRHGGMISWTEAAMVARLGEPTRTFEVDLPHPTAHAIRPSPPDGPFRTLIFQTFDGTFVAWFTVEKGAYTCFRSTWIERGVYY
jgi:hypothetical protein